MPGGRPEPGWPHRYWVETGRAKKFAEPDPTFEQVLRAESPAEPEARRVLTKITAEALPAQGREPERRIRDRGARSSAATIAEEG